MARGFRSVCRFEGMPLLAIIALLLFAPVAFADSVDDYRAVHNDWERDGKITPCKWTVAQLKNAREIADDNPDDTYNSFPDRVDDEIARWRRGECAAHAQIAGVKPKTGRVRLVNRFSSTVNVGGMRLRDRQGNSIRLPRGMRIPPGGSVLAYSEHRIWDDGGDIARLVTKSGKVLSQYGYGRFSGRKRF